MGDIWFNQVSKQYIGSSNYALKGFELHIEEGELIVVVGPSGSGKSTLLEMICGFESLTSGDITIDGESIITKAPKDRNVAMVFQNYALLPHLNVYENIAFGMKMRKTSSTTIKEKVEWAAKTLELEEYLKVKPKKLSGGQRQRVALARAIVREPKLFLMDEPLSNLDAKLREHMSREIKTLHQKLQATMIYITHDQVEAMTMADRIVILKDGEVQQIGTPLAIYHQPANLFVAQFVGRQPMNVLKARQTAEGIVLEEDILILEKPIHFEKYTEYLVGIRSEDLQIVTEEDKHLEGIVTQVEFLGSEQLVYLQYKNNRFVAKEYKNIAYKVGQKVNIKFDLTKAHYFDLETQQNIKEL